MDEKAKITRQVGLAFGFLVSDHSATSRPKHSLMLVRGEKVYCDGVGIHMPRRAGHVTLERLTRITAAMKDAEIARKCRVIVTKGDIKSADEKVWAHMPTLEKLVPYMVQAMCGHTGLKVQTTFTLDKDPDKHFHFLVSLVDNDGDHYTKIEAHPDWAIAHAKLFLGALKIPKFGKYANFHPNTEIELP